MKLCIVIPVYNHGSELESTLDDLRKFDLPTFVIDDASDETNRAAIDRLESGFGFTLIRLQENQGKGGAVIAGLEAARQAGFSHALQVDADGQHDLNDVPKFLAASASAPNALISGSPRFAGKVPASRLHGRQITAFWVCIETLSRTMPDTMCGFRIYPLAETLKIIESVRVGRRMDFDIEIAVRLYWQGTAIVSIPTTVVYPEGGTSNFQMFRDNVLISRLHTRLFFGMLPRAPGLLLRRVDNRRGHWSTIRERGSIWGMKFLFGTYRVFGRPLFSLLLYPVIGYFFLTSAATRRVSANYLDRVRRRRAELGMSELAGIGVFRHLLAFGHAVLDKAAMWAGTLPPSQMEFDDWDAFERFRARQQGSLFLGSHLGNLEVLRAFGESIQNLKVNALVFTRHSENFNRILGALNPQALEHMIQVDSLGPESVQLLQDRLAAGEHVAIVADRTSVRHRERSISADFLGEPAQFPEGPFILAHLLRCHVYLLFCLRMDGRYRIFLEPFAAPLELPRQHRAEALQDAVSRFASRLEHYCLIAPLQWFNFFDFWDTVDSSAEDRS